MAAEKSGRRLGRGLDALLGAQSRDRAPGGEGLRQIPIADVRANPFQPRKEFAPHELTELTESLRASGMLQPITVREAAGGKGFELIAGERRLRAATSLGWAEIPAIVRKADDRTLLTLALIENLQRADLNPIEEATGYRRLTTEFALTQQQVAELVGKDRSTIANLLRLLELPDDVQTMVRDGRLSMGHVRPLLALKDGRAILAAAQNIIEKQLNVRAVEAQIRTTTKRRSKTGAATAPRDGSTALLKSVENQLRRMLQTDVTIKSDASGKGELSVRFYSAEDLERVVSLMGVRPEDLS